MKLPFMVLAMLFISVTGFVYANDGNTVRLEISVRDSYTEMNLESARVSILRNDQVIGSAYTDSDGMAVLDFMITSVDGHLSIPVSFSLSENYPNPFYDETRVNIDIPETQTVRAEIYNTLGQRILTRELSLQTGMHGLNLSMSALPTGVYFLVVHGSETQTVKLSKMGRSISQSAPMLSYEPVQGGNLVTLKKAGGNLLTIRVEKDQYESKGIQEYIMDDTAITMGIDRLNEVVFNVTDDEGQIREGELHLSAPYVNLFVTAPDTIILKSGVYNVKADMHFSTPVDKTIEIASVDTTFNLSIETINAMVTVNEDLESELLFIVDHIDGHSSYMYGTNLDSQSSIPKIADNSESSYMDVTHLIIRLADGTITSIILNEDYYPILWVDNDYEISTRRLGGEPFNPELAPHSFFAAGTEEIATINIKPGNLYSLIDWLENETGDTFTDARNFLDAHTGTFEELQELAKTVGNEQDVYIYAVASFSILAAVKAFHELTVNQANKIDMSLSCGNVPSLSIVLGPMSLAQAMLRAGFRVYLRRLLVDRSGPTVNVFTCRGATCLPNTCQETFHTGTVSRCLNRCPVSIACFVDICIPDIVNVNRALNIRQNY